MILDIDIGNTRLKWRVSDTGGEIVGRGCEVHARNPTLRDVLSNYPYMTRVRLSSVEGDVSRAVVELCEQHWHVVAEVATVVSGAAGVVCGYDQPGRLGVDRWLAVVAAWLRCHRDVVVVDAGSALTIDVVSKKGVHLGGYILPGLDMMKQSLGGNTWGVDISEAAEPAAEPGRYTGAAVTGGAVLAAVGAVERVVRDTRASEIMVTGGDGPFLVELIKTDAGIALAPDLVLEGLAILLP